MPTIETPVQGAPIWVDLWTSDVPRAREFYARLFGWHAEEQNPEFGGYFQFSHNGSPIAGGAGDMPDNPATNVWTAYFHTTDIHAAAQAVASGGGTPFFDPMTVGDLGQQFQFCDPQGARVGIWQPNTFSGFTVTGEPNTPGWFELHTPDHTDATAFYRSVLGWDYDVDEFRYWIAADPEGGEGLAGLMDNRADIPEGGSAYWRIYWSVSDVESTIATAVNDGATVIHDAEATPYGILAELADPMGAVFSLRGQPG